MLLLKRSKSGNYELSDKTLAVELSGRTIKLGDNTIDTPGEYEQGGVEIIYANNAVLLVWDHLQINYVFSNSPPDAFEKNQFSSTDILLLSEDIASIGKDKLAVLTNVYDPRAVIFGSKTEIDSSYREIIKPIEEPTVKLNAQALPMEGRDYSVLI
ncbi:MAG: hypothetical protein WD970_00245 [Patescibacteria group bacterium]